MTVTTVIYMTRYDGCYKYVTHGHIYSYIIILLYYKILFHEKTYSYWVFKNLKPI